MMRIVYAIVALLSLLAGLVVQMPASMFATLVQGRLQQRVVLSNLSGSFWQGKGHIDCITTSKAALSCGDWTWSFVPASLSEGRVRWRVNGGVPSDRAIIAWSPAGLQAESMELGLPAAMLAESHPKLAALQLRGRLRVSASKLDGKEGRAEIKWAGMSSQLLPGIDLGEHGLAFMAAPGGWKLSTTTLSGPLSLAGEGEINRQGQAVLKATITLGDATQRVKLAPFLGALGAETSPGVWTLDLP